MPSDKERDATPRGDQSALKQKLIPTRATGSSRRSMWLERIEPSLGRGERIRLDRFDRKVSLGRAEENGIRLYTSSASREHAVIVLDEADQWMLTPTAGRFVLIDGEVTRELIMLEVGMNIILGQDHLRCVAEVPVGRERVARTEVDQFKVLVEQGFRILRRLSSRMSAGGWPMGVLLAMIGVGLILFTLLRG